MTKFFDQGTADIDQILEDEFSDEGLNIDVNHNKM